MFSNDWVGKKVVFEDNAEAGSFWYPPVGTVGEVLDYEEENDTIFVQWPKGTTGGDGQWWVFSSQEVNLVEDNIENVTNNEIWEMLKIKMEKNNIYPFSVFGDEYYTAEDTHNAVALAYKIGYLRATKGRPFKYSQTKISNL